MHPKAFLLAAIAASLAVLAEASPRLHVDVLVVAIEDDGSVVQDTTTTHHRPTTSTSPPTTINPSKAHTFPFNVDDNNDSTKSNPCCNPDTCCKDRKDGTYPYGDHCKEYISCNEGEAYVVHCLPPYEFNWKTGDCDDRGNVDCEEYSCPSSSSPTSEKSVGAGLVKQVQGGNM